MYVCVEPVNNSTALESTKAVAMPMMVFVEPGPMEVNAASGFPEARK